MGVQGAGHPGHLGVDAQLGQVPAGDAHGRAFFQIGRLGLPHIDEDTHRAHVLHLHQRLGGLGGGGGGGQQRAGVGVADRHHARVGGTNLLVGLQRQRLVEVGPGRLARRGGVVHLLLAHRATRHQSRVARLGLPGHLERGRALQHLLVGLRRAHPGDDLPGLDPVAFVDLHLFEVAGNFRVHRGALQRPNLARQHQLAHRRRGADGGRQHADALERLARQLLALRRDVGAAAGIEHGRGDARQRQHGQAHAVQRAHGGRGGLGVGGLGGLGGRGRVVRVGHGALTFISASKLASSWPRLGICRRSAL